MTTSPPQAGTQLSAEKVAYWYFRLNGYLQLENFIVHPERYGSQRTDADILAVRFPHRAERLFDFPFDAMSDDNQGLKLSADLIDVVIAEVKTNSCTLNGPWTRPDEQNVHRVLAAIGCLPHALISEAAKDIYCNGAHSSDLGLRIRLIAIGRDRNDDLASNFPLVRQLIWSEIIAFIWDRFRTYRRQKTQVDQWDFTGKELKRLAGQAGSLPAFTAEVQHLIGVQPGH